MVQALLAGAQINTDQVMRIGRNSLAFDDYVLAIQYFNQVIQVKPYLAKPYFYRGVAKYNLDDFRGAETDASLCIERNPFIVMPIACEACRAKIAQNMPMLSAITTRCW